MKHQNNKSGGTAKCKCNNNLTGKESNYRK